MLKKISLVAVFASLIAMDAFALDWEHGGSKFKLDATGTIGSINPDFETPLLINDWRVRAQYSYNIDNQYNFGLVYSIDAMAIDMDRAARDAFMFFGDREIGRIEIGLTDSVAKKMGLGLPDVGGLRLNEAPIFYKKINPYGSVISDVSLTTGWYAPRINFASAVNNGVQYGVSIAGLAEEYSFATDAVVKIRKSSGKTKTAFMFGLSYMNSLDNYKEDMFSARVFADWRAQFSAAMNLQYNSWILGLTARAIYDEKPSWLNDTLSSDGVVLGAGVSYDLMKYTLSATYLFSDTGIWDDTPNFYLHTGLASFRYKYSQNVDMWMSVGITGETPFFGVGIRAKI